MGLSFLSMNAERTWTGGDGNQTTNPTTGDRPGATGDGTGFTKIEQFEVFLLHFVAALVSLVLLLKFSRTSETQFCAEHDLSR